MSNRPPFIRSTREARVHVYPQSTECLGPHDGLPSTARAAQP